jgi:hypothetical protein
MSGYHRPSRPQVHSWDLEDGVYESSGADTSLDGDSVRHKAVVAKHGQDGVSSHEEVELLTDSKVDSRENLQYLVNPMARIHETKETLQKLGTVHMLKRRMRFNDSDFETAYIQSLEGRIRSRMFFLGLVCFGYGMYCLFFYNFFGSTPSPNAHSPLIYSWATSANVLYNLAWLFTVLIGIVTVLVSLTPSVFPHSAEVYLQISTFILITMDLLFGNMWRVTRLTSTNFFTAFPNVSEGYPDSDTVIIMGAVILYLAVVVEMRFRRLVWISLWIFVLFVLTLFYFGLPDFTRSIHALAVQYKTGSYWNPRVAHLAPEERPDAILRALLADSSTDVPESSNSAHCWLLTIQLSVVVAIAMFGKTQLELLQRKNFLELALAQKRIEFLETTISAIDSETQSADRTQARLSTAEKLIDKLKLVGNLNPHIILELDQVAKILKETEKTMTLLDFQKEILLAPLKTGHEYKPEEVMGWIGKPDTRPESSSTMSFQPTSVIRKSTLPSIPEQTLGVSAVSLMKRIGVEWDLNLDELEKTLNENGAIGGNISVFQLTARACLNQFIPNVLAGTMPNTINLFAKALDDGYLDVSFHNAHHAALTCHHANVLMNISGVKHSIGGVDRLALVVAALGHDLSHFGRSNDFLVATKHELAIRYNDSSVLENFHAAKIFEIIAQNASITSALSTRDERRFRNRVIQLVLATSSSDQISFFHEFKSRRMFSNPEMEESDKRLVLTGIIKTADIGYMAIPTDAHVSWVNHLTEELAQQGDVEFGMRIPVSPMCDRANQNKPNMMLGLFSLIAMPLFDEMYNFILTMNSDTSLQAKTMAGICANLVANHAHWQNKQDDGKTHGAVFLPIPKDVLINPSQSFDIDRRGSASPPALVPIIHTVTSSGTEGSLVANSGPPRVSDDDDEEDDEPPMLPFNQAHK